VRLSTDSEPTARSAGVRSGGVVAAARNIVIRKRPQTGTENAIAAAEDSGSVRLRGRTVAAAARAAREVAGETADPRRRYEEISGRGRLRGEINVQGHPAAAVGAAGLVATEPPCGGGCAVGDCATSE